jgi:hypothetical protein
MVLEVLAELPWEELAAAEIKAILDYDTLWPRGFNSTPGGNGVVRLQPRSEVARVKRMKATMASRAYKQKQRNAQSKAWTPEKRAARAEAVRAYWQDPEYRARQMVQRRKPRKLQPSMKLARSISEMGKKRWADPENRARYIEAQNKGRTPDYCRRVSNKQREVMQNMELRYQIALSMSKYKNHYFRKLHSVLKARKPSIMTRTWGGFGDKIQTIDLVRSGWTAREMDRAIERGWLAVYPTAEAEDQSRQAA